MVSFERPRRQLSPLRVALIVGFLSTLVGTCGYLLYVPMMQVYWGVYSRLRPMISEDDLLKAGKPLPGKKHAASGRDRQLGSAAPPRWRWRRRQTAASSNQSKAAKVHLSLWR